MCRPRLRTALQEYKHRDRFVHLAAVKQDKVRYIGRPTSATTATAAYWIHAQEQNNIINEALTL
jgi:2-oxoglutarate dehydrogenase complex dehydrogenase (E1) component-like enzyme